MRNRNIAFVLLLLVGTLAGPQARAADPPEGTISLENPEIRWDGGPFLLGIGLCLVALDPTCDTFFLTVDAPEGRSVEVAVASAEGDVDLRVYAPDGTQIGASLTRGGDNIVFRHSTGYGIGPYEVRVSPFGETPSYEGLAHLVPTLADPKEDCSELVPHRAGVQGITDDGRQVSLDVHIVVDERPFPPTSRDLLAHAAEAVESANRSYNPLGIDLNAVVIEAVDFDAEGDFFGVRDVNQIFSLLKQHFGGARPEGVDIVYYLTNKDLTSDRGSSVAGIADCIGGIEDPRRAFALGEIRDPGNLFGFTTLADGTAKILAHELGHIMGAHHHYGNCAEGDLAAVATASEISPCTLMFPDLTGLSLDFGTLNGAVVRGHATVYAGP